LALPFLFGAALRFGHASSSGCGFGTAKLRCGLIERGLVRCGFVCGALRGLGIELGPTLELPLLRLLSGTC
jgi:hypothetical protein